ncbi:septal ring lytic transglycosylase RlpA family protein [Shewanella sp. A25]|nr:septal ring lytic transglycosylase RlpA family protein [Shewanella shenzhenensis]
MKSIIFNLALAALLGILSGCSSTPGDKWQGYTDEGQASYYANKHQNRKTASGERYQHQLKTAAHREIPFGSEVKVTNLENGKAVVVRINDRGPFVRGRIIDLSKSAFKSIGKTSAGVLDVKIEVIKVPLRD